MAESEQDDDGCRSHLVVIDAISDPIIIVRPDFRVQLMNDRARELFPLAAQKELLCHQLFHHSNEPCCGEVHPCPMRQARETGKTVKAIHEHFDDQGRRRFVQMTASRLRGDQDRFCGVVVVQRDVTATILIERKLAEYAVELKDSNLLKDLFIDIMRHDLMNPVTGIITAALCALESDPAPRVKEDLQEIARLTRQIINLVQNASILAHLDSGDEHPFMDTDLIKVAQGAIRELRAAVGERGMKIELRGAGPAIARVTPLIGDVFTNLISNAVKYGVEGSGITVAVEPAAGAWRIAVVDCGAGVPDKDKQAIFTRFTRRAKEGVKGTGLGLSIVRKIAEAHGGRAWVEDNPGGGSIFIVELPQRGS